jgi:PEP-CTERM motif
MKRLLTTSILVAALSALGGRTATAIPIGPDTFEDGTTNNWLVNLLGTGPTAPVPVNVPTGGPAGLDDAYMLLTSIGGLGEGSRLAVLNVAQWSGNYIANGVSAIKMDLLNVGSTDLSLRVLFEAVGPMGPTDVAASTNPVLLAAGSGWTSAVFPILPTDLTAVEGSVTNALSNTVAFRIFNSPTATFPPPPIVAQLGVDNIQAVPEPASAFLLALGLGSLALRGRRRNNT